MAELAQSEVIELTSDIVPETENLYALRVKGNALVDALVNDGDVIILQPQAYAENGEMVAVRLLERGETTFKRFYRENGHVRLQPVDPTVESLIVKPEAVAVQGKVVAIIRQVD
jgi:repressor LexA